MGEYKNLCLEQYDSALSKLGSSSTHIQGKAEMSLVALHISPSGREESESKETSVINTRHPINPALKEEGRPRAAHWLEGGLVMPEPPAWPVAAQRIWKGRKESR